MRNALILLLVVALTACATAAPQTEADRAVASDSRPSINGLGIVGYNYTDLYIYSFEVNGHGGGNIEVSTPTSGDGGTTCCMSVYPALVPYPVTIKWKARTGKDRWCETKAMVTGPIPAHPANFEVHFYPDGHIEIGITEDSSPPRLKLQNFHEGQRKESGNIVHDEEVGRCQDGYF